MQVNQRGEEAFENEMFCLWSECATDFERDMAIALILDHLKLKIVRTNATKHGDIQLVLKEKDDN